MQSELNKLPANCVSIFPTLLGSEEKQNVALHCAETASSVLNENFNKHPVVAVSQTTADFVANKHYAGRAPDLLKADVQGYELEVLKGSEKILNGIAVMLLEINLIEPPTQVPWRKRFGRA